MKERLLLTEEMYHFIDERYRSYGHHDVAVDICEGRLQGKGQQEQEDADGFVVDWMSTQQSMFPQTVYDIQDASGEYETHDGI